MTDATCDIVTLVVQQLLERGHAAHIGVVEGDFFDHIYGWMRDWFLCVCKHGRKTAYTNNVHLYPVHAPLRMRDLINIATHVCMTSVRISIRIRNSIRRYLVLALRCMCAYGRDRSS